MLRRSRLFSSTAEPGSLEHRLPEGRRVYAIGDLHGCADLLQLAAEAISEDLDAATPEDALTIFLGDYVDRGPDTAAIVERLSAGDFPTPILCLMGNHEFMMLRALVSDAALSAWCDCGGLATLFSYGIDVRDLQRGTGMAAARKTFSETLPARHRAWLEKLRPCFELGDYFFCHAGIRPNVPLSAQVMEDLIWIREPFTSSTQNHGKLVVHGHTPVMEPDIRSNRINIDTGACMTGTLTVLRLEGGGRRLIPVSTRAGRPGG